MEAQEVSYLIDACLAATFAFSCLLAIQPLIDWAVAPRKRPSTLKGIA